MTPDTPTMDIYEAETRLFAASDLLRRLGITIHADSADASILALRAALETRDEEIARLRAALETRDEEIARLRAALKL